MNSAISDTGYSEQVMRTAQEFAEVARSCATEDAEDYVQLIMVIAGIIAKAGMKK